MKIGTLTCILFGHNFLGEAVVYEPHYLDLVKKGMATMITKYDYHTESFRSDYCIKCGIKQ